MNTIDVNKIKEEFITTYKSKITRAGSKEFLEWLESSDFFVAPSSTRFHCAYEGGLCEHSLNVYKRLVNLVKLEESNGNSLGYTEENLAISALLHDVCKVFMYKQDYRNQKNARGVWESVPYYVIDEKLPLGHGEKSVMTIMAFMKLTGDEIAAINWHMGGFDKRAKGGDNSISLAYEKYPLAVLLQSADFMASYLDEKIGL